jgi:hypothetical protein
MKYYMFLQDTRGKLKYKYWVIVAKIPLIKFQIWSCRKSFNCTLYTEEQTLELIQKTYPEAIRIPKPKSNRWKKIDSK